MIRLRTRQLAQDPGGLLAWQRITGERDVPLANTAVILCDVWDRHWSAGAQLRLTALLPRMNAFVQRMRDSGALIIHAPSDTMRFYQNSPARLRMAHYEKKAPSICAPHPDVPLPVVSEGGGSDSGETANEINHAVWTRQHPAIVIDEEKDGISDSGEEIYALLTEKSIQTVFLLGVHANMCILNRSFGIRNLVQWGLCPVLVRDLTDAMYCPADPPYVSHDEGTRLVIDYIESFWCPTALSTDILPDA